MQKFIHYVQEKIKHIKNGVYIMGKRKDKPRWKDLSFDERALKIAKQKGCSEFTLNFLKERIARNNAVMN